MLESLNEEQRHVLDEKGFVELPSDYSDEPYVITAHLLREGERNLFLTRKHHFSFSIKLIQGMKDMDVPWQTTDKIRDVIDGDVEVLLIEEGDHRLSSEGDLIKIDQAVQALSGAAAEVCNATSFCN